ncbi:hypothetical protein WL50_02475 [Burkholderia ubonensis]|nr:hypothetical protein WL50_02475 [Burkholderia ubonensis]
MRTTRMSERPVARIGDAIRNHGLTLSDHRGYRAQRAPGDVAFDTDMAAAADAALVLVTVKSAATRCGRRWRSGHRTPNDCVPM